MELVLNHGAIIGSAVLSFALGMLWWSPVLFENQWIEAMKKSGTDVSKMKKDAKMGTAFAWSGLGWLVSAYVLAIVLGELGVVTWMYGVKYACILWLGFNFAFGINSVVFEGRPKEILFINSGYYLVGLMIMGAIIGHFI